MSFRTTYALFAVLLALIAAVVLSLIFAGDDGPAEGLILGDLQERGVTPADVTRVEVRAFPDGGERTMVFERGGSGWLLTDPKGARIDSAEVQEMVRQLFSAAVAEGAAVSSLAWHGLDSPTATVTLVTRDDRRVTLKFGKVNPGADNALVYLIRANDPREVLPVRRGELRSLFKTFQDETPESRQAAYYIRDVADFRPRDLLGGGERLATDARSVRLAVGKAAVRLTRSGSGWAFAEPKGYGRADATGTPGGPIDGVNELLGVLGRVEVRSPRDFIDRPNPLGEYGLAGDSGDRLTVEASFEDGSSRTVYLGAAAGGGTAYAKLEGDNAVAKVPAAGLAELRRFVKDPDALRDRQLLRLSPATVDAIEISRGGETFRLYRAEGAGWLAFDHNGQPRAVREEAVKPLLATLTRPDLVKQFPGPGETDASMGFKPPVAALTLYRNAVSGTPGKEPESLGEPAAVLKFGRSRAGLTYLRLEAGRATADAMVPEAVADAVEGRGRLDYIRAEFDGFPVSSVTKLTVNRDGQTVTVERRGEGRWRFTSPERFAGRSADAASVSAALSRLAGLRAERVVDDKPDDAILKQLKLTDGLSPLGATVALGKGETRRYTFGGRAAAGRVYARVSGTPLVVTVEGRSLAPLRGNLLDLTVYRIDPDKVQRITLEGWAGLLVPGKTITRAVRRDGGRWAFEGDLGYQPNAAAVESLLRQIAGPRATKFVAFMGRAGGDYGLDLKQRALKLSLTLEGVKDPLTLTVGKPADGGGVYAETSRLPGDVFVLPAAAFEPLKRSAAVFSE